jgi:hypothetical protein
MAFEEIHDAQNGNQKNNMISSPIDDSFFVSAPYAVPFHECVVAYEADKSRNKITAPNLKPRGLPRKTTDLFQGRKFSKY